jgi:hypothetical protein
MSPPPIRTATTSISVAIDMAGRLGQVETPNGLRPPAPLLTRPRGISMFDNARMLDLIERPLMTIVLSDLRAPTTIEDDDGRLWLVCSAALEATTVVGRVSAAILPHRRRLVVDLAEHIAA